MKILFVYPNSMGYSRVPPGLAVLIGVLKGKNHQVKVFDTSFYKIFQDNDDDIREKTHQVRKADLKKYGVAYHWANFQEIISDCFQEIENFQPDLIGFSVVTEDCAGFSFEIAEKIKERFPNRPIIFGGVAVTTAPEDFINRDFIDLINVGEGEDSLSELLDKMSRGEDIFSINNLWLKKGNQIIKNKVRPLKDINQLSYPDFDEFSDKHFYRPIDGIVYRTVMVEFTRGCPRRCSYCINHILQKLYSGKGRFVRKKSNQRMISELIYLKNKHNLTLFFFTDDDFLVKSDLELKDFLEEYRRKVNLPFLIQAGAPTITEERVRMLKKAGCITICMGIESGNEFIKKEVFNRYISNDDLIRAFKIVKEAGIRVSSTNIIGNPYETREMIFDTIKLNRLVQPDSVSNSFMTPYKGTKIREIALKEGYISNDLKINQGLRMGPVFEIPEISKEELKGIQKMFTFYVRLPKIVYPLIRYCERERLFSDWLYKIFSRWVDFIQEGNRKKRIAKERQLAKQAETE